MKLKHILFAITFFAVVLLSHKASAKELYFLNIYGKYDSTLITWSLDECIELATQYIRYPDVFFVECSLEPNPKALKRLRRL